MSNKGIPVSGTDKTRLSRALGITTLPLYLGLAVLSVPLTGQAEKPTASSDSRSFNIAPQPLYSALSALAEQSGVQFVYNSELVKGLNSPGLSGEYSLEVALKRLLAGSGIAYRFNTGNTVTLEKMAVVEPQSAIGATTLPSVTVTGTAYGTDSPQLNHTIHSRITSQTESCVRRNHGDRWRTDQGRRAIVGQRCLGDGSRCLRGRH